MTRARLWTWATVVAGVALAYGQPFFWPLNLDQMEIQILLAATGGIVLGVGLSRFPISHE